MTIAHHSRGLSRRPDCGMPLCGPGTLGLAGLRVFQPSQRVSRLDDWHGFRFADSGTPPVLARRLVA